MGSLLRTPYKGTDLFQPYLLVGRILVAAAVEQPFHLGVRDAQNRSYPPQAHARLAINVPSETTVVLPLLPMVRYVLVPRPSAPRSPLLLFTLPVSAQPGFFGDDLYRLHLLLFLRRDGEPPDDLLVRQPVAGVPLLPSPMDLLPVCRLLSPGDDRLHAGLGLGLAPARLLLPQRDPPSRASVAATSCTARAGRTSSSAAPRRTT